MRLLTIISPARNRTMKKVKVILFVYVAGALSAIAVMMALRGYAHYLNPARQLRRMVNWSSSGFEGAGARQRKRCPSGVASQEL
jgi:hypothetical protein